MRRFLFAIVIAAVSTAPRAGGATERMTAPPEKSYAVLASRQDPDEAIGLARSHPDLRPTVMHSINGWYAVVAGPYDVKAAAGRDFLDGLIKEHALPKDSYPSHGVGFDEVLWRTPAPLTSGSVEYDGEHDVTTTRGDLTLTLSRTPDGDGTFDPVLRATWKGAKAFSITIGDNQSETPSSKVEFVRLDAASPLPQVVFTYFTHGAHCCTITRIISLAPDSAWRVVDGDTLDGGGGYDFEDLAGEGFGHLVSSDNAFLYAFAPYASSYAPIRIQKLVGATIVDVTREPAMRHRVLQDLARMEPSPTDDASLRSEHGYLAGWVAESILAGRGPDAWRTMLATYDRAQSEFGPETCSTGAPIASCPEARKVKFPFPMGLKQFLVEHGYVIDQAAYPVPAGASPAPVLTDAADEAEPRLQTCAGAAAAVRKLVYQTFAGRKLLPGEDETSVTIAEDVTLEGYDPTLRKATCAVDYTMVLRPLIGRLAEEGDMARAAAIGRLSRRSGGTVSHRVKYTVKPTATPGTTFIELLP